VETLKQSLQEKPDLEREFDTLKRDLLERIDEVQAACDADTLKLYRQLPVADKISQTTRSRVQAKAMSKSLHRDHQEHPADHQEHFAECGNETWSVLHCLEQKNRSDEISKSSGSVASACTCPHRPNLDATSASASISSVCRSELACNTSWAVEALLMPPVPLHHST